MNLNTWIRNLQLAGVVVAGLVLALNIAPAGAQSDQWNALYDRIIRLEAEVRSRETGVQPGAMPGNEAYRVSAMEDQLRQLGLQVQQLQQQMQRMQADMDYRLQQVEQANRKSGAIVPQPSQQQWAQQQVIIPQQQNETVVQQQGVDLGQYQSQDLSQLAAQQPMNQNAGSLQQAQGPQVLGQLSVQSFDQSQDSNSPGLVPETVESASLDGNQMTGSGAANQIYQGAYDSLLGRQFGTAEAGFRTFLTKYPDHALAGDALYWLGETYFAQGDYKQAAQNFLQGYRTYPSSKKAPDSLLKLGMSLAKLGQKPKACGAYAEVTRKYATAAAVRNQALLEMKRAGC